MPRILGVDPGRKGALALMSRGDAASWRVETHDMPAAIPDLQALLPRLTPVAFAVVEKPFYNRIMGTSNAGRSGEAYGVLLASLHAAGIPIREVRPDEWKRALNIPKDKTGARQSAGMMFPDDADQWPLVKHDGRAEAALLAWYGKRWSA